LTTESPAEAIGGVERKTALAFELALDGAADFAGREKLERFAVKTGMLDRTEDLFAGLGKEVGPGFLQRVEGDGGRRGGRGCFRGRGTIGGGLQGDGRFRRRGGLRWRSGGFHRCSRFCRGGRLGRFSRPRRLPGITGGL